MDKLLHEPAVIVGVIVAVLNLLITVGVPVTTEQAASIKAFAEAMLVMAGALVIRARVTPI